MNSGVFLVGITFFAWILLIFCGKPGSLHEFWCFFVRIMVFCMDSNVVLAGIPVIYMEPGVF